MGIASSIDSYVHSVPPDRDEPLGNGADPGASNSRIGDIWTANSRCNSAQHLQGDQRISAQLEEVVLEPNLLDSKHILEYPCNTPFKECWQRDIRVGQRLTRVIGQLFVATFPAAAACDRPIDRAGRAGRRSS